MERWKVYRTISEKPSWLTDIMDIKVRIDTHSDNIFNGHVPSLLERVESGSFDRIIGTNGHDSYAYIEYGNLDGKSI